VKTLYDTKLDEELLILLKREVKEKYPALLKFKGQSLFILFFRFNFLYYFSGLTFKNGFSENKLFKKYFSM